MNRWIVAAGIPLVFGLALAACNESGSGTTFGDGGPCPGKTPPVAQNDADMSVEELTDLVAEAVTCPGYAFHVQWTTDVKAGPYSNITETEAWLNIEANSARSEMVWRRSSQAAIGEDDKTGLDENAEARVTNIFREDARYSNTTLIGYPEDQDEHPASRRSPSDCHGLDRAALGIVLPCFDGPLQDFKISIDPSGSYNGRDANAYVAEGESRGEDETYYLTTSTFFDAESFLPIGQTSEGTLDIGDIHPVESDAPYEHEFVALDSLPEDFFDPASIGYVEPGPEDVEKPLDDAEIEVYWLGSKFTGSVEYPALAVDYANVRTRSQTPEGGYIAQIAYRPADDEFGRIWVRVELYTPEAFDFREERTHRGPCQQLVELDIAGMRATIERAAERQRPDGPCDQPSSFSAFVHFEEVVLDIDAPTTSNGRESFPSPYDSEEGMELLIRSLELRE